MHTKTSQYDNISHHYLNPIPPYKRKFFEAFLKEKEDDEENVPIQQNKRFLSEDMARRLQGLRINENTKPKESCRELVVYTDHTSGYKPKCVDATKRKVVVSPEFVDRLLNVPKLDNFYVKDLVVYKDHISESINRSNKHTTATESETQTFNEENERLSDSTDEDVMMIE